MSNTEATHCKSCGAKLRVTQTRVVSWRTRRTRVCPTEGCKASVRETSEIPDTLMNYLLAKAGVEFDALAGEWIAARSMPASTPASQPDTAEPVADYAAAIRADIEENRESRARQIAAMKNNRRDPDGSWRDPEGNIVGYWRDE